MGGAEVMVLVVEEGREGREGRGGKGSNGGSDPVGGSDMAICYLGKRGGWRSKYIYAEERTVAKSRQKD